MKDHKVGRVVTHDVTFECVDALGRAGLVDATVSYDASDPYAVTLLFHPRAASVAWIFARDLLVDGRHQPTGVGDVSVHPGLDLSGRAVTVLELHTPEGSFLAQARTPDVTEFLRLSGELVPLGAEVEFLDLDLTIGTLLGH